MLSLIRHSSLPLPIKTFIERDPILAQFIGLVRKVKPWTTVPGG